MKYILCMILTPLLIWCLTGCSAQATPTTVAQVDLNVKILATSDDKVITLVANNQTISLSSQSSNPNVTYQWEIVGSGRLANTAQAITQYQAPSSVAAEEEVKIRLTIIDNITDRQTNDERTIKLLPVPTPSPTNTEVLRTTSTATSAPTNTPRLTMTTAPAVILTATFTPPPPNTPRPVVVRPTMWRCSSFRSLKPIRATLSRGTVALALPEQGSTRPPRTGFTIAGTYENVSSEHRIWVLIYSASAQKYYPQTQDAAGGWEPPPLQPNGGNFSVNGSFGNPPDQPDCYEVIVVVANAAGSAVFKDKLREWTVANDFRGFLENELPLGNIQEMDFAEVLSQQ